MPIHASPIGRPLSAESLSRRSEHGQWRLPWLWLKDAIEAPSEGDPASLVRDRFCTLPGDRHDLA